MTLIKRVDISVKTRFVYSTPGREVIVMVKGVDAVSSSGHPGAGCAGPRGSRPGDQPSKRERPIHVYEDQTTSMSSTREKLYNILQALRSLAEAARSSLKFRIHEATDQVVVEVIAEEDGRVVREIPSEALLDLETRIDEMTGVLFSKDV
jgi:flagellar protein FlaG